MQKEHWGAIEEECGTFALDKYVPTTAKKPKLDELRQRGDLMTMDKQ